MKPAAATAMSVAPLRIAPEVATVRPVAVVVVIVCPLSDRVRFARSGDGRQRRADSGGNRFEVERVDRRREPVAALAAGLDVLDRAIGGPEGPAVDDPGGRPAGRVGAGDEVGHGHLPPAGASGDSKPARSAPPVRPATFDAGP